RKIILTIALLGFAVANAQNTTNNKTAVTPNKNYFYDATFNTFDKPSLGKGLNFPRTDLTKFEFSTTDLGGYQYSRTAFDGLVVYNTATGKTGTNAATQGQQVDVTPGFYYFSNPNATEDTTDVSAGKWVRLNDGVSQEPWYDKATNTPATSNTQNIYQLGNVAVGFPYNIPDLGIIGRREIASVALGANANGVLSALGSSASIVTAANYGDVEPFVKKWSDTGQRDVSLLTYNPKDRSLGSFLGFDYKSAWESTSVRGGAGFRIFVDGDITETSKPSRIEFVTTANDEVHSKTRMTVKNDGNVGIGTTTPTEKLEVAGKVKATAFMGASGATIFPDYVFQEYYTGTSSLKSDYSFKTLSQVEDFVKTNGHLPGYQSAAEIKKQGYIDLMATQLTNVEKIEELYLHSIEQDKALKTKDAEIKELKTEVAELKALVKELLAK
ncbi:hypothetical protein PG630_08080, partial [Riemerella anatipestifer]|nr:hypothetical protein [Riemerella anatipestifer]